MGRSRKLQVETARCVSGDTMGPEIYPGSVHTSPYAETESGYIQKCVLAVRFVFAAPLPARGRFSKKFMDGCPILGRRQVKPSESD